MSHRRQIAALCPCLTLAVAIGCGTTRWSDTTRTATEQMLMSDAIERAVSQLDFSLLSGRDVYLETKYIAGLVDEKYVTSTIRQHMIASGCVVHDKPEEATYVIEIRAGALGTNRNDLLFGMPATSLPAGGAFVGAPTAIPEIPLIKRTAQQGVAKLAVFAYDRTSGSPVWQSGTRQQVSKAKDVWVFGTGPFQHGTIYDGAKFAGEHLKVPLAKSRKVKPPPASVSGEVVFAAPPPSTPARLGPQNGASAITPVSATMPTGDNSPTPLPPTGSPPAAVPPPPAPATSGAAAPAAASPPAATTTASSSSGPASPGASARSSTSATASPANSATGSSIDPNANLQSTAGQQAVEMVNWARTVRSR